MTVTLESLNPAVLRQAANALEEAQQNLDAKRNEVFALLAGKPIAPNFSRTNGNGTGAKRPMSAAAKQKISEAQTARWKREHAAKAAAAANGTAAPAATTAPAPATAPAATPAPAAPATAAPAAKS